MPPRQHHLIGASSYPAGGSHALFLSESMVASTFNGTDQCPLFVLSCQAEKREFTGFRPRRWRDIRSRTAPGMTTLFDVERLAAGRLALRVEGDLLDARLGLAQKILTTALERLAALIDGDRSASGTLPSSSRLTIDPVRSRARTATAQYRCWLSAPSPAPTPASTS